MKSVALCRVEHLYTDMLRHRPEHIRQQCIDIKVDRKDTSCSSAGAASVDVKAYSMMVMADRHVHPLDFVLQHRNQDIPVSGRESPKGVKPICSVAALHPHTGNAHKATQNYLLAVATHSLHTHGAFPTCG